MIKLLCVGDSGELRAKRGGDLAADRRAYYDKWCARIDGDRVCRFCGEVVNNDVYTDQDQFDEEGFAIRHQEAFEQKGFHGDSIQTFTTGLSLLRPLFLLDNAHDETVMLVLSIIQVLPNREHLELLRSSGFVLGRRKHQTYRATEYGPFGAGDGDPVPGAEAHVPDRNERRHV